MSLRRDLFIAFSAIVAFLAFIPIFTYVYFAKDLTSKEGIMNKNDTGVILLDRNNKPFFSLYDAKQKDFVPMSQIPKSTQLAVIAAEDKDFYYHPGFSIKSIIRSVIMDIQHQGLKYGGSTITQQLVKNSLLTSKKDFLRKYQEVVLAQEIDRRYSKAEILEMYLNSVYFGQGSFGVEEATQTYFGKDAQDLDLAESATLAALLPEPSKLSPFVDGQDELIKRQKIVLQKMVEQKYISRAQQDSAGKKQLNFTSPQNDLNKLAPHFAMMVRDQLDEKYGEEVVARSGFRVKTSLDLDWQQFAEKAVADQVKKLAVNRVSNGAAVVMDPKTGEIRAMVGSKDWYDDKFGKVNVTLSARPPGSSFKPIVYSAAFEKLLITPATILHDQPTTYSIKGSPPYSPKDFDGKFRGPVTVRRALSNSLNVPAVEVMNKVGVQSALEMAHRLGITTLQDTDRYGLSLVLGAGEIRLVDLTAVYSVFANNGLRVDPTAILEIDDKLGHQIYQHQPQPQKVLEPDIAFLITSILSDNFARKEEFGDVLTISRPAAVKTGTTEDFKDSLTMGYTPTLTIGVWVGNNDNTPMDNIAGALGAAPIWKALMEKFLSGTPIEAFKPPSELVAISFCEASGSAKEYFIRGTEPKDKCLFPKPATPSAQPVAGSISSPSPIPETPKNDKVKKDKKEGG